MIISLSDFLKKLSHGDAAFLEYNVWHFSGPEYPLLFFSTFFKQLKHIYQKSFLTIPEVSSENIQQIKAQLSLSFLGAQQLYWLKQMQADQKNHKEVLDYLKKYQGPHIIAFFSSHEDVLKNKDWLSISIPAYFQEDLHESVESFFSLNSPFSLFGFNAEYQKISLDSYFLLLRYLQVCGRRNIHYLKPWLHLICGNSGSLFTLSQSFFAKQSTAFFKQLSIETELYQHQFWIAFWSEQLWRAAMLVYFNRNKKFAESKKISFRLPFSFIQRDWKKYTFDELARAHAYIAHIDFSIKNGGMPQALDLFFTKFFQNMFV